MADLLTDTVRAIQYEAERMEDLVLYEREDFAKDLLQPILMNLQEINHKINEGEI